MLLGIFVFHEGMVPPEFCAEGVAENDPVAEILSDLVEPGTS